MTSPWAAALFALFTWWFATGLILLVVRFADRKGAETHRQAVLLSVPVAALGTAGIIVSLADPTVWGVYVGFVSALCVWGWIELAFLGGVITGHVRTPCPPQLRGFARFEHAWGALVHHELLLLTGLLMIVVMSVDAVNTTALWTYVILFGARILAKLNLFFGVPRINVEFVPAPLEHIKSLFRIGSITIAFPIAITVLSFAVACLLVRLYSAETDANSVGLALIAAMAALALLEHWLMVLPLPDAKLWRWMLPAPKAPDVPK